MTPHTTKTRAALAPHSAREPSLGVAVMTNCSACSACQAMEAGVVSSPAWPLVIVSMTATAVLIIGAAVYHCAVPQRDEHTHGGVFYLRETGKPPVLPPESQCVYHLFMSHTWKTGQDQVAVIKRQLSLMLPSPRIFLDVDDLDDVSMIEQYVRESAVVLIFMSRGYFLSRACLTEVRCALAQQKPLVLVHERSVEHGGSDLESLQLECPEALRTAVFFEEDGTVARDFIMWHRTKEMQACSLQRISEALLLHTMDAGEQGRSHEHRLPLDRFEVALRSASATLATASISAAQVSISGGILAVDAAARFRRKLARNRESRAGAPAAESEPTDLLGFGYSKRLEPSDAAQPTAAEAEATAEARAEAKAAGSSKAEASAKVEAKAEASSRGGQSVELYLPGSITEQPVLLSRCVMLLVSGANHGAHALGTALIAEHEELSQRRRAAAVAHSSGGGGGGNGTDAGDGSRSSHFGTSRRSHAARISILGGAAQGTFEPPKLETFDFHTVTELEGALKVRWRPLGRLSAVPLHLLRPSLGPPPRPSLRPPPTSALLRLRWPRGKTSRYACCCCSAGRRSRPTGPRCRTASRTTCVPRGRRASTSSPCTTRPAASSIRCCSARRTTS